MHKACTLIRVGILLEMMRGNKQKVLDFRLATKNPVVKWRRLILIAVSDPPPSTVLYKVRYPAETSLASLTKHATSNYGMEGPREVADRASSLRRESGGPP